MSELSGKNKGVAAENMGKERQKVGIYFLRSFLGATEVVSETANMAFWLHARFKSVRLMLMVRKIDCIRTNLLKCPTGAQSKDVCEEVT